MVTYPSTHGVFEEGIRELCAIVHDHGGQVYVDGANLNALVGAGPARPLRRRRQPPQPAQDVLHPPRRRRPGHRPGRRALAPRAVPARPSARCARVGRRSARCPPHRSGRPASCRSRGRTSRMMGAERAAPRPPRQPSSTPTTSPPGSTPRFPVLYRGHERVRRPRVHPRSAAAHQGHRGHGRRCRQAPDRLRVPRSHVSFPVAGTLMVEPTESESKAELDRFCDAMLAIRAEIDAVAAGEMAIDGQPAAHRPAHRRRPARRVDTAPYPREAGAYPMADAYNDRYFPPVSRIDAAYGDRNLICSCEPLEALRPTDGSAATVQRDDGRPVGRQSVPGLERAARPVQQTTRSPVDAVARSTSCGAAVGELVTTPIENINATMTELNRDRARRVNSLIDSRRGADPASRPRPHRLAEHARRPRRSRRCRTN